jgi:hypothetical protein
MFFVCKVCFEEMAGDSFDPFYRDGLIDSCSFCKEILAYKPVDAIRLTNFGVGRIAACEPCYDMKINFRA